MKLPPGVVVAWSNTVAHALGLRGPDAEPLAFPENGRGSLVAVTRKLGEALDACAPSRYAPSIGALLGQLAWSTGAPVTRGWPPRPSKAARPISPRRALAELEELVAQGAYDRTRRAERGRVLAEMLLLFDLEGFLAVKAADDPEDALRQVRRALAAR